MRPFKTACTLSAAIAMWVTLGAPVQAQSRHRTSRGHGSVYRPSYRGGYYRPSIRFYGYLGAPYYYSPFFGPYYGAGFYPGYYGYGYGYGYAPQRPWASFRIDVEPRQAQVYVDGYYAGIVDNYDGILQRLNVPPGNHEIEVYLEGYRTLRQALYVSPGGSYKIKQEMTPLAPGEAQEPPPQAREGEREPQGPENASPVPEAPVAPAPAEVPAPPAAVVVATPPAAATLPEPAEFGVLEVRAQPTGVRLRIDGEAWLTEPEGPVSIHLPRGRHRVEIEKEGYQSFAGDVVLSSGRTTTLNVKLSSSDKPRD